MAIFRTQNNVPAVYCDESRDFQIFCRLYDAVFNSIKFNIDSIENLTDTSLCQDNVLELLATKLGFFTKETIEPYYYRFILQGFVRAVKNKGSITSIRYAVNLFLKMHHIVTDVSVWYTEEGTMINHTKINDHTIIIGIEAALKNTYILDEIFKYILPVGYGLYIYFYNSINEIETYVNKNEAVLIYVSHNINSQVRAKSVDDNYYNRLIGAVDTIEIDSISSIIPTKNNSYLPGDDSMFIGILDKLPEGEFIDGNIELIKIESTDNYQQYMYKDGAWQKTNLDKTVNTNFMLNQTKEED